MWFDNVLRQSMSVVAMQPPTPNQPAFPYTPFPCLFVINDRCRYILKRGLRDRGLPLSHYLQSYHHLEDTILIGFKSKCIPCHVIPNTKTVAYPVNQGTNARNKQHCHQDNDNNTYFVPHNTNLDNGCPVLWCRTPE